MQYLLDYPLQASTQQLNIKIFKGHYKRNKYKFIKSRFIIKFKIIGTIINYCFQYLI